MIGTPFFGGHVVRWTPYFRGTSLTLFIVKHPLKRGCLLVSPRFQTAYIATVFSKLNTSLNIRPFKMSFGSYNLQVWENL